MKLVGDTVQPITGGWGQRRVTGEDGVQGQWGSGLITCVEPLEGWVLWGSRGLCRCDAWGMGLALRVMGVSGAEDPPLGPWATPRDLPAPEWEAHAVYCGHHRGSAD